MSRRAAINLDVLIPEGTYLEKATGAQAKAQLQAILGHFRNEHFERVRKVVASAKCDAIIFSITTAANVIHMKPRLHYLNQTDFWTLSNGNFHGRARAKQLANLMDNAIRSRRAGGSS